MKTHNNKVILAEHLELIEKLNSKLDKLKRFACDIFNKIDFDIYYTMKEEKKVRMTSKKIQWR